MTKFSKRFTTKQVDLYYSGGSSKTKNGWIQFSIEPDKCFVYIARDTGRVYWIGRDNSGGKGSANLTISFNDTDKIIRINTSNKIVFHNEKDYLQIKNAMIRNKLMKPDEHRVVFSDK
jgi:hypothetical protein